MKSNSLQRGACYIFAIALLTCSCSNQSFNIESLAPADAFDRKHEKLSGYDGQLMFFRVRQPYPATEFLDALFKKAESDGWRSCSKIRSEWSRYLTSPSGKEGVEHLGKNAHFLRNGEVLHVFLFYDVPSSSKNDPARNEPLAASVKYARFPDAKEAQKFFAAQGISCLGNAK